MDPEHHALVADGSKYQFLTAPVWLTWPIVIIQNEDSMDRAGDTLQSPIIHLARQHGHEPPVLLLQGDSMVADPDEKNTESELDVSSIFNFSPAPRSANAAYHLLIRTWPKHTGSPICPNRSSSYNESHSIIPLCFSAGMVMQSPHKPLVATMGYVVKDPVGIAFSKNKHTSKILPCHKDLTTDWCTSHQRPWTNHWREFLMRASLTRLLLTVISDLRPEVRQKDALTRQSLCSWKHISKFQQSKRRRRRRRRKSNDFPGMCCTYSRCLEIQGILWLPGSTQQF
ncbi:hypothetical protein VP01_4769g1 [Puccinia sorghi]|uniref:Uncharacterized protein n=1 Tax=Puccinia sorghi TaxID=27349 RepID=A0A0L6UPP4_9BASI|nr:hypothetical protein VP01_4769g1 [Puccinia sorghi]